MLGIYIKFKKRLTDHNNGIGGSYSNKNKPFKPIFYEAFLVKEDAMKQKNFIK